MDIKIVNYSGNKKDSIDDLCIEEEAVLALDGSTSRTGISIITRQKGLIARMRLTRQEVSESPVRYKLNLKNFVLDILNRYANIKYIAYEEPCIYHKSAIKNLFMLRTFIEELIIENEPKFNYIRYFEVANTKWKKIFLHPIKLQNDTEKDKKAVNDKVKIIYNIGDDLTFDESDCIGLGYATVEVINGEKDEKLTSQKKPSKFNYEIEFADEEDEYITIESILEGEYNIPKKVIENGIKIKELSNRERLENKIYTEMQDEDCVLLIKFDTNKHGNVVMKYGLSGLLNETIYAVVWRKSRKKLKQW